MRGRAGQLVLLALPALALRKPGLARVFHAGAIPPELGQLGALEVLNLSGNKPYRVRSYDLRGLSGKCGVDQLSCA